MYIPYHDQILIVLFQVRQGAEHDGHMRQAGRSRSLGSREVEGRSSPRHKEPGQPGGRGS